MESHEKLICQLRSRHIEIGDTKLHGKMLTWARQFKVKLHKLVIKWLYWTKLNLWRTVKLNSMKNQMSASRIDNFFTFNCRRKGCYEITADRVLNAPKPILSIEFVWGSTEMFYGIFKGKFQRKSSGEHLSASGDCETFSEGFLVMKRLHKLFIVH